MTTDYESLALDGLALNDGVTFDMEELDLTPPAKRQDWVENQDASGALLAIPPTHEKRTITAKLRVPVQASVDACLDKIGQIEDKLQKASLTDGGIPCVWTPNNSARTLTFYVLDGEITGIPITTNDQDSGWLRKWPLITIRMDCKPFGYGAESLATLTDHDPFTFDSLTNQDWRFDTGGGTLAVSGGVLTASTTAAKRIYRAENVTDATGYVKFTTGASVLSTYDMGVELKRLASPAGDCLQGRVRDTGTGAKLDIGKIEAGVFTALGAASGVIAGFAAATSYWIKLNITGNVLTANLYTTDPNGTNPTASIATNTQTLAGADATKFGTGVKGSPGLAGAPKGTDWTWDDFRVDATAIESLGPAAEFALAAQAGDVDAEARLVVTDTATQARAHFEWGLENLLYDPTREAPLLIDSDSLITTGFVGTGTTRSGAYDPGAAGNSVVRISGLVPTYQAACGIGTTGTTAKDLMRHTGRFRAKARVYASTNDVSVRLASRYGDQGYGRNDPVTPWLANTFLEIDLGEITIPTAAAGATQQWDGRIEVAAQTPGATLDVDYVELIPAERYGKARAPLATADSQSTITGWDYFNQTAGNLTGKVADVGGTWTVLPAGASTTDDGDADDWAISTSDATARRAAPGADSSLVNGRFVTCGTATATNVDVSCSIVLTPNSTSKTVEFRAGLLARATDTDNWLMAVVRSYAGNPGNNTPYTSIMLIKRLAGGGGAGLATTLAEVIVDDGQHNLRLTVDSSGNAKVYWYTGDDPGAAVIALNDANLASGTLSSGRTGIYAATNTIGYVPTIDNFSVSTPSAAILTPDFVCASTRQLEVRSDDTLRQDTGATRLSRPPVYRGSRFYVPAQGDADRWSRIFAKLRRGDVDEQADDQIADAASFSVYTTPRYLVVPRS